MLTQRPPPASLARWVDAFWDFQGEGRAHRVLPDGCMDFLFDLQSGEASLAGPMTHAEVVTVDPGARLFGVRFRPGAAALLLEAPADALRDQHLALRELTVGALATLGEQMAEAADHAQRCQLIGEVLHRGLGRQRAFDARVHRAATLIVDAHGTLPISRVAAECGMGERQLERLFRERVGLGPKLCARIARLRHAVALAESGVQSQAGLAARAGYADEAHLLRDFRQLAGASPLALRSERDVGFVQASAAASS